VYIRLTGAAIFVNNNRRASVISDH